MPLYHSIITTTAAMAPKDLTALFRNFAKEVNKNSGVFRSCENYGLKAFPHRIRSVHATVGGGLQYHHLGRRVGLYYDCGSNVLPILENILRLNKEVLRFATLRPKVKMDKVNSVKKDNPWKSPPSTDLPKTE